MVEPESIELSLHLDHLSSLTKPLSQLSEGEICGKLSILNQVVILGSERSNECERKRQCLFHPDTPEDNQERINKLFKSLKL